MPLVPQAGAADCAAACLSMILRFHGSHVPVRRTAERLGVDRDGATALDLIEGARSYGLSAKACSLDVTALPRVPVPAVLHWDFHHFVVLERCTEREVLIVDPAVGRRRVSWEQVGRSFTGVVLAFEPGPDWAAVAVHRRHGREPRLWRLLRSTLWARRRLLLQVLLASVLLQLLGLTLPVVAGQVIDDVLPFDNRGLLRALGAGLALAVLMHLLTGYLRTSLLVSVRVHADAELSGGVVRHLLALPFVYFGRRGAADLVSRVGGVAFVRDTMTAQALAALLDGPLAAGYLLIVLVHDPVLGSALLVLAVLQVLLLLVSRRRVTALAEREFAAVAAAEQTLIESITQIETVKAAGAEARVLDRWSARFAGQLGAAARSGRALGLVDAHLAALRALAPVMLLWIGAWRVLDGALSLGTMLALNALATAVLAPLASLITGLQRLQSAAAHLERITDIMATDTEQPSGQRFAAPVLRGAVALHQVGFRYGPRAPWILRDISLRIPAGSKVAVVGASGSGKSTLARLLLRLYDPTEGELAFDGLPAAVLDRRSLRRQFGVVIQSPALFTGSIRDNICLNDPGAPLERVVEAARLACVHEDIACLPMSYETMLVGGGGLSGGQSQRLALARALLGRPRILVLDEATSNLDTATEAAVEANLTALRQTRIVIAHRLSTIRDASLIVVLDKGRIVEQGTHGELLALRGHYHRLVERQAEV
ncbi:NHLP family bacteriocin export ABC transporter peptidase/permease/ATPase subunit [Actinocorallia aurantiaca]|uniref:NHLP family bacteriocin export ABC transporter peptidase/permease/ATPase subunit n=1 Tax=Actinocorallia aurantiaca TaxID=46204 RepID=A0ABP6GE48_9ACTN